MEKFTMSNYDNNYEDFEDDDFEDEMSYRYDDGMDEIYPDTEESRAYREFEEEHPRLLYYLGKDEIPFDEVIARLDWYIDDQEEQKKKAAEILCKLYEEVNATNPEDIVIAMERALRDCDELKDCGQEIFEILENEVWI
jgi:hypothetical protein